MKKLLLSLLLILCLSFQASAFNPLDVMSGKKTVTSPTSPCPFYYASAILSWNGDHTSGVLYGCNSVGTAILFTDSGADIGAYGETGNGMKIDDAGEDIMLTQSVGQYFNSTADQTLCMKVKITAALDATVVLWQARDAENNDRFDLWVRDAAGGGDVYVQWSAEGGNTAEHAEPFDLNTWEIFGGSWEGTQNPNGDLSANSGEQATWADGWSTGTDVDHAHIEGPITIRVGSVSGDPGNTEIIYIDEWYLFSGNKVNCSDYF